jgi:HPt (histidine-containing phosphotransfer) domain-containing protein
MNEYEIPDIKISDIKIPGINGAVAYDLYDGEMDIYIAVLQSFADNTLDVIDKLRVVSAESLDLYATNVHGLKGSCASVGADDLAKIALDLETKSKAGDLNAVLAGNEALVKDTETLVRNLREWLNSL